MSYTIAMSFSLVDFKNVLANIHPYIKKTTLMRCTELESFLNTSCRIFLKLENEQPTKSFKVRGAFNALLSLSPEARTKGVVTRSSGNFAQAIAYAGKLLGIKTRIIMPENVSEVKKAATESFQPEIILVGTTHDEGERAVEQICLATGACPLSPYNHKDVIAGQGTISLEIYNELPTIRHFFCPIGGGGLIGGCANALKLLNPEIEIIGVEPIGAADYYLSRLNNPSLTLKNQATICDGLRATQVGALNRPLLDRFVDKVLLVTDDATVRAMKFMLDRCGLMIEPSAAAALAGLINNHKALKGDVVCVISGANIDEKTYDKCCATCLAESIPQRIA